MSVRAPVTRHEFISDAILWLKDAIDEDRAWGEPCPSSDLCLQRAKTAIDHALLNEARLQ